MDTRRPPNFSNTRAVDGGGTPHENQRREPTP